MDHEQATELGRALFEESGDAMFLIDPETDRVLDANPMAERLSGYSREELLGVQGTSLFQLEDQGTRQRVRQASVKTGIFHSQDGYVLRTREGGAGVPVSLTITRLHVQPRTLALFTARDVREQRAAHAQLQQVEAELRRVLASVTDCLWSAEIDGQGRWTFKFFSPVVEKITGRPPEKFLGGIARWREVIHPEDRAGWKRGLAGLRPGQSRQAEYRIVWPDGSVRWVRDSVVVSRADEDRALRLDGVLTDITERKQTEDRLQATEAELRVARQIQQRLFPARAPRVPGFEIAGVSHPAQATGGDYFDYLPMGDDSLGIVIGDVSGHGFGPALLMAATRSYLRVLVQTNRDPGAILTLANRVLSQDTEEDRFITLLLARLDVPERSLSYTSAGQSTGYVLGPDGEVRALLKSSELPLGIYAGATYETGPALGLGPGEVVLLITDGVLEAAAPDETTFGAARALDVVRANRERGAREIVDALYQATLAFCGTHPPDDDITVVVIKVLA